MKYLIFILLLLTSCATFKDGSITELRIECIERPIQQIEYFPFIPQYYYEDIYIVELVGINNKGEYIKETIWVSYSDYIRLQKGMSITVINKEYYVGYILKTTKPRL